MEFYSAKDGMAIIDLIISGKTAEEATSIVNPIPIDIPVSDEVEEFCADLEADRCPECGKPVDDQDAFAGLCSQECYLNVFEDTTPVPAHEEL